VSNIQKLNQKLVELGLGRLKPARATSAEVDNTAPLKVGLVQINNSFSGQNYLPYAAGLLQAYVAKHAKHPQRYTFLLPVYSRIPVQQAVDHLLGADVIGFFDLRLEHPHLVGGRAPHQKRRGRKRSSYSAVRRSPTAPRSSCGRIRSST